MGEGTVVVGFKAAVGEAVFSVGESLIVGEGVIELMICCCGVMATVVKLHGTQASVQVLPVESQRFTPIVTR